MCIEKFSRGNLSNIPAVAYGREYESIARDELQKTLGKNNFIIIKSGLVVSNTLCYVGASPDGLIKNLKTGEISLLEIKCPWRAREVIYSSAGLEYITKENKLKTTHEYFSQCQIGMDCSNTHKCLFYVYSPMGSHIIEVIRDQEYIDIMYDKFRWYMSTYYIPEVLTL